MSIEEEVAYLIEERFREQYHIIDFPIWAAGLEFGMVVRLSGRLVVVKSIERIEPERVIVNKRHSLPLDGAVVIWQMNNKPFLIHFPDELLARYPNSWPPRGTPPTPATAHVSARSMTA